MSHRYRSIREAMRAANLSALVLYSTLSSYHEVLYLSNFLATRDAFLVFPAEGEPTLFVQMFNHVPDDVLDASESIHQAGFTICDDLVHGFGGGYLAPILRTRRTSAKVPETFVFQENMVVVVQPNVITEDGRMGVQVGEMMRVVQGGVESLHRYPMRFVQC